jgi:hypothetical protein
VGHVVAHKGADEVDVLRGKCSRFKILRVTFAPRGGAAKSSTARPNTPRVQLAHIMEHAGQGAVPVVGQHLRVIAHHVDGVREHGLFPGLGILDLLHAGQGRDFGNEAVQDLGFEEQLHEGVHVLASTLRHRP